MKRISRFLAVLAALMMLCTSALADLQVYAPSVNVQDDGVVRAVVYASKDGTLAAEDLVVMLDTTAVTPTVTSFERSDMGVSWIYVVDLSGADRKDHIKSLLTGLVSNLGEFDNAAVYTTDMEAGDIQLTQDKAILNAAIDQIAKNSKADALNSKISDALSYLEGNSEACDRKGIVVISNGHNDDTSVTMEELLDKTAKSEVVVYTLAVQAQKPNSDKVNTFGSIARSSKGGLSITVPYATKDMSTAISQISSNEKYFRVVDADPASLEAAPSEWALTVRDGSFEQTVTASFSAVQRAAMTARINARIEAEATPEPTAEPTPEPTVEPTATPEPTAEPTATPEPKFFEEPKNILLVLGGVLAVLVIVLVVVVVTKKKKPSIEIVSDSVDGSVTTPAEGHTEAVPGGVTVVLDTVSNGQSQRYTAQFTDTLVVGRVASKSRIVIPDEKVSGAHLRLTYAGGMMYIEDLMSRNGTKVNGSSITGRMPLQRQDVITIGTTNLRINWQ